MATPKVLIQVRPSWWNFLGWIILALLIVAAAVALSVTQDNPYILAGMALALAPLAVTLWKRFSVLLFVDENQVELRVGLLNVKRNSVYCSDVRAVETGQSILQRIVGIGTIKVGTAGTEGWEIEVAGIPDPRGLEDIIEKQKHLLQDRRRDDGE